IAAAPVWPATVLTVMVRLVPLPPMMRLPFGTSDGLDELASTCREPPEVPPRLPKLNAIGPLELPGGMFTSAIGDICAANARNAVPAGKAALVMNASLLPPVSLRVSPSIKPEYNVFGVVNRRPGY